MRSRPRAAARPLRRPLLRPAPARRDLAGRRSPGRALATLRRAPTRVRYILKFSFINNNWYISIRNISDLDIVLGVEIVLINISDLHIIIFNIKS